MIPRRIKTKEEYYRKCKIQKLIDSYWGEEIYSWEGSYPIGTNENQTSIYRVKFVRILDLLAKLELLEI